MKTLITADFKPNSNFPPRKEILDAAEKQITMWISEWDSLMRYASGNSLSQSGLPAGSQIGDSPQQGNPSQGTAPQQSDGSQNFSGIPLSLQPDYTNDGLEQDIKDILDLDFVGPISMMQRSNGGNLQSFDQANPNSYPVDQQPEYPVDSGFPGDTYTGDDYTGNLSTYPSEGFTNDTFLDPKNFDSQYSEDASNNNYCDNFQNSYQNTGPNNYGDSYPSDNYSDPNDFGNFSGLPPESGDNQANNDVFGLDSTSRYLPPQQVLGKRKTTEPFSEKEQPPKYSKTNPM